MEQSRGSGWMTLVTGILDDFQSLLRQEVQLLRDEILLEMSKAGRAASGFGVGAVLTAIGLLFLLLMLVHGLHEWTGLPLWASYGVIGIVLAGIGISLLAKARSLAGTVETMPRRTLFAMKENVEWIKEQITLKKT
ncbi:MAG TPA: phage holin family protein [Nitrospira sp.]|nr:phage holin family protein [Nitrospira sp.]